MDWKTILDFCLALWFITIPILIWSYALAYFIITELLDLIFNSGKINQLLKHSDSLNTTPLETQYELEKVNQSKLTKSILMELGRQIDYKRLNEKESKSNWSNRVSSEVKEKIISAKRVSDIFKIK